MLDKGESKKPIYKRWWVWLIVVLFAFVVIGNLTGGSGNKSSEDGTPETSAESSENAGSNDDSGGTDSSDSDIADSSTSESSSDEATSSSESFDTSQYADIHSKFSDDTILSQPESDLSSGKAYVLNHYYIKSLGADSLGNYHLLLSNDESSDPRFLVVFDPDKGQKFSEGTYINAYGILNGVSIVNSSQIKSGISPEYSGQKAVLFLPDHVVNDN
ncbi:hypothetical protein QYI97_12025 [Lacticaseibacillus paracasei]|uniref:hypothetical protein n=1 Tax=Lacticaseibacillus paracasei TaxID=1597 RepID=UPI00263188CB|nr:hypothetical protein [Lacticaseibacillus paracasei]MDN4554947.1 hypothetical protein [Lacticaseibacillus paracasei]